jgi:hypothetical protein
MIDAEVLRLRRLRKTSLRALAIAAALQSRRLSTVSASAAGCWRIARVITGRLRAHPYPRYHQGPGQLRGAYDRVGASVLAVVARYRGRSLQTLSAELRRVVRELDDARALTLSADLSESFGRSQTQIRKLIEELEAGARDEAGTYHETASREARADDTRPNAAGSAAANWPYLAF